MAKGINKVTFIGNLGKDPELRHFPSGDAVCSVSLATTESWNDKQTGEKKEETQWHNLVFNKKMAESICQYAKKGSKLYIEGTLKYRKYTKDNQERQITEVVVKEFQFLDAAPSQANGGQQQRSSAPAARPAQQSRAPAPATAGGGGFEDDDIPF